MSRIRQWIKDNPARTAEIVRAIAALLVAWIVGDTTGAMEVALGLAGAFIGVDLVTSQQTIKRVTPVQKAEDIVNNRIPSDEHKRQVIEALRKGQR